MPYSINDITLLTDKIGIFNSYAKSAFIIDETDIYLIDTGTGEQDGKDILKILKSLYPEKKIKAILNTHSHADHCGGNYIIQKETQAEIWTPEKESHIMAFTNLSAATCWGGNPFEELKNPVFTTENNTTATKIINGKIINLNSINISCIPLPGHFLDQTGFLVFDKDKNTKAFFLGDGFFGSSMLKRFWIPFMYNPVEFRNSINRIENTNADYYIPAHGEIYTKENINAIAEINIMVTLELESLIINLLKKEPMTQERLLKKAADYAEIKLKMNQYILIGSTIRSYLSSLYDRKLIRFEIINNEMIWLAN